MWRKVLVIALLAGAFAMQSRSIAQQNSPSFSVSVNLVKVPISIFDERGNLAGNLRREDFRIWEDQVPQEIRSFGVDSNPVSIVLVLDTSTSEKSELKKIRESAEEFAGALSREDRISLLTFDDEVHRELDWTNSQKIVRKALGKIHIGLRTALYDAMYLAASEQLKGVDGRKAIILLTDCLNNQSLVDFKNASLAITQSQASLYVVSKTVIAREEAKHERRVRMLTDIYKRLFGNDDDYIDEFFKKREAEMTALAEETGGRCFFPADYDHIKNVYAEVARELKSKYFLTYISSQQLPPDSFHRISIEYLAPATKILYRKSYYYQPRPVRLNVPLQSAIPLGAAQK
jgi:Ca-activated chloride channel homolog